MTSSYSSSKFLEGKDCAQWVFEKAEERATETQACLGSQEDSWPPSHLVTLAVPTPPALSAVGVQANGS